MSKHGRLSIQLATIVLMGRFHAAPLQSRAIGFVLMPHFPKI
jgi:hypothetical protein